MFRRAAGAMGKAIWRSREVLSTKVDVCMVSRLSGFLLILKPSALFRRYYTLAVITGLNVFAIYACQNKRIVNSRFFLSS
jgi:hypothetical protein